MNCKMSGGARVITHTVLVETDGADITFATIYDKDEYLKKGLKIFPF